MHISDAILLVMMTAVATGCSANDSKQKQNTTGTPEATVSQQHSSLDELLRKTPSDGSVRVIVQLNVSPGPDATREARIKSAQQALLDELAGVAHKVLRTYSVTPAIALEASRQALVILRDSPHVSRVDEDALAKPFK
jgi:hypothetical protein